MSRERPGRLPSLRGPRDLTLGGVRKKTFAPKIPVRKERNKQEPKEEQAQKKPKADGGRREKTRGRGRGRGRGRPEIIQSHSIFEAGPSAEPTVKRSDAGFGAAGGGGGGGVAKDAIEKPSLKHEVFDEDLERTKTEEALKSLEGDTSFIADLESDDTLLPTCLPMSFSSWPPGTSVNKHKPKIGDIRPSSPDLNCDSIFGNSETKQESQDPTDVLIFQLPDTLPATPPSTEAEIKKENPVKVKQDSGVKIKQEPGTENDDGDDSKRCTLDQLSEGYIGKLQVMKSGRCRLLLGDNILNLEVGTPPSFLEELVSVRLPPEGQEGATGHMSVLGNVNHKIICTPDMEYLIRESVR